MQLVQGLQEAAAQCAQSRAVHLSRQHGWAAFPTSAQLESLSQACLKIAAGQKACIYATHIYVPFMLLLCSPLAWITHSGYLYRQIIYKANGTEAEQLLYEQ